MVSAQRLFLKRLGTSEAEPDVGLSARRSDFELSRIRTKYPERKIRIPDMIGRRGRSAVTGIVASLTLYLEVSLSPG